MRSIISAYDFLDYIKNRAFMKFNFYFNRLKRDLILGKDIKTILIVRLASIGDVVRSTAVITSLKKKYPFAKIDYLTTDSCLALLRGNPHLNKVYSLKDISLLGRYDWIINLQAPPPPEHFIKSSAMSFSEILNHISKKIPHKFISGRHIIQNKEVSPTNIFYCNFAIEELFLISLLKFSKNPFSRLNLFVNKDIKKFNLNDNTLTIFLGSNSSGGDDGGFRTYSISFLAKLIDMFYDRFNLMIIGQSSVKTKDEMKQFKNIIKSYPKVKNLVDKTSLGELISIIRSSKLLISSDSSPLHIALAVKTPVIGLFPNHASFEVGKIVSTNRYAIINSVNPCFRYSWRWKFFCTACSEKHARMYHCTYRGRKYLVDNIPLGKIQSAVNNLLSH